MGRWDSIDFWSKGGIKDKHAYRDGSILFPKNTVKLEQPTYAVAPQTERAWSLFNEDSRTTRTRGSLINAIMEFVATKGYKEKKNNPYRKLWKKYFSKLDPEGDPKELKEQFIKIKKKLQKKGLIKKTLGSEPPKTDETSKPSSTETNTIKRESPTNFSGDSGNERSQTSSPSVEIPVVKTKKKGKVVQTVVRKEPLEFNEDTPILRDNGGKPILGSLGDTEKAKINLSVPKGKLQGLERERAYVAYEEAKEKVLDTRKKLEELRKLQIPTEELVKDMPEYRAQVAANHAKETNPILAELNSARASRKRLRESLGKAPKRGIRPQERDVLRELRESPEQYERADSIIYGTPKNRVELNRGELFPRAIRNEERIRKWKEDVLEAKALAQKQSQNQNPKFDLSLEEHPLTVSMVKKHRGAKFHVLPQYEAKRPGGYSPITKYTSREIALVADLNKAIHNGKSLQKDSSKSSLKKRNANADEIRSLQKDIIKTRRQIYLMSSDPDAFKKKVYTRRPPEPVKKVPKPVLDLEKAPEAEKPWVTGNPNQPNRPVGMELTEFNPRNPVQESLKYLQEKNYAPKKFGSPYNPPKAYDAFMAGGGDSEKRTYKGRDWYARKGEPPRKLLGRKFSPDQTRSGYTYFANEFPNEQYGQTEGQTQRNVYPNEETFVTAKEGNPWAELSPDNRFGEEDSSPVMKMRHQDEMRKLLNEGEEKNVKAARRERQEHWLDRWDESGNQGILGNIDNLPERTSIKGKYGGGYRRKYELTQEGRMNFLDRIKADQKILDAEIARKRRKMEDKLPGFQKNQPAGKKYNTYYDYTGKPWGADFPKYKPSQSRPFFSAIGDYMTGSPRKSMKSRYRAAKMMEDESTRLLNQGMNAREAFKGKGMTSGGAMRGFAQGSRAFDIFNASHRPRENTSGTKSGEEYNASHRRHEWLDPITERATGAGSNLMYQNLRGQGLGGGAALLGSFIGLPWVTSKLWNKGKDAVARYEQHQQKKKDIKEIGAQKYARATSRLREGGGLV